MKYYETKLHELKSILLKSLAIGLLAGFGLGALIFGFSYIPVFLAGSLLFIIPIFCIACVLFSVFTNHSENFQNFLYSAMMGVAHNLFGSGVLFSIGSGALLFTAIGLIINGILFLILTLFASVSFPLSAIVTVVMYFVEKKNGMVDPKTISIIENLQPAVAIVICIGVYMIVK